MQCQHTEYSAQGVQRVCPSTSASAQFVKYADSGASLYTTYFWCATHAPLHLTYPNGAVLAPDADGMVTLI